MHRQDLTRRDKMWQDLTRHDKTRQDATRRDKIWQDVTRCYKLWQDATKSGKTWRDVTKCDQMRQDTTDKTRCDKMSPDATRRDKIWPDIVLTCCCWNPSQTNWYSTEGFSDMIHICSYGSGHWPCGVKIAVWPLNNQTSPGFRMHFTVAYGRILSLTGSASLLRDRVAYWGFLLRRPGPSCRWALHSEPPNRPGRYRTIIKLEKKHIYRTNR